MGLEKIGALWKGKPGSKAVLSGSIEVGGKKYRALIFKNDDKEGKQPDYRIMTDPDDVSAAGEHKSRPESKPQADDSDLPF